MENSKATHLDLRLGHGQLIGELGALWAGQVFGLFERLLEHVNLVTRKGWSRVLLALAGRRLRLEPLGGVGLELDRVVGGACCFREQLDADAGNGQRARGLLLLLLLAAGRAVQVSLVQVEVRLVAVLVRVRVRVVVRVEVRVEVRVRVRVVELAAKGGAVGLARLKVTRVAQRKLA